VGAAEVLAEDDLTAEHLCEVLSRMLADGDDLVRRARLAHDAAQPEASERLADLVEKTAK
jgi:UDP-N-acetylglucosamine--N-acetylmuramyl-(pentapeptide) pyrophosphoryl-undecaprenol N-acetylglucosamine transferase